MMWSSYVPSYFSIRVSLTQRQFVVFHYRLLLVFLQWCVCESIDAREDDSHERFWSSSDAYPSQKRVSWITQPVLSVGQE